MSAPSRPASAPVLVIVDPAARAQPALVKAARLAAACKARLVVYACDWREGVERPGRSARALKKRLESDGQAALGVLVREHLGQSRRIEVQYELGHPRATRILRAVARLRPRLVVLDSHFHAESRRAVFGAADWPLIRDCRAPLLYAKPGRWRSAPRVAAAVDPRHPADPDARLDQQLVETAHALARQLSGSLCLVNAWLPLEPPALGGLPFGAAPAGAADLEPLIAAEERASRAAVEHLAGRLRGRPTAQVVLLRGAAVETLPGFADVEGLDVLVMGAVSRSRLYELLVGATAERLLERVPCDVLVVKGPRHRSGRRIPV